MSLQLRGVESNGAEIRADCFVENTLLLRADPTHRSAWRGALALLDAEGVPELADIAAIFSLGQDIFDGHLFGSTAENLSDSPKHNPAEESAAKHSIAVWPPQPDVHGSDSKLVSTLGNLHWFQNILSTLLHAETSQSGGGVGHSEEPVEEPSENKKAKVKEVEIPDDQRTINAVMRIWKQADKDYEKLREALFTLCPSSESAKNVWPAAVFVLLSTFAVLRCARRKAPDAVRGDKAGFLCDGFLRVMFSERRQDADFCCPSEFRYRGEKFPPLADDLRHTFNISVPRDLGVVLLALMIDRRLRMLNERHEDVASPISAGLRRQIGLMCGDVPAGVEIQETCRRLWRRYICDQERFVDDADFDAAFGVLCLSKQATGL